MANETTGKKTVVTALSREGYLRQLAASDTPLEIHLTNDYAFRKTFKNTTVLKGFLMALLGLKPEQITRLDVADPCEEGENDTEKEGILDIKVHMNDNQKINIEMQNAYQKDWAERSLFYTCRMYTEGFLHGIPYGAIEPCIHVGILNFNQSESEGYHHCILLSDEKTREVYSSKIVFHMIELKKIETASEEKKRQELYHWTKLIAATSWEEIRMEAKGNSYMEAAVKEMEKINQNEDERYLYLRREMALSDEKSRILTAEEKGREEGRELGRIEGIKALIRTCQDFGLTIDDTASRIEQLFEISQDSARKYVEKYWEYCVE